MYGANLTFRFSSVTDIITDFLSKSQQLGPLSRQRDGRKLKFSSHAHSVSTAVQVAGQLPSEVDLDNNLSPPAYRYHHRCSTPGQD